MLARCTSSLDLHMLIVPYWYLFRTLLVPKVALGHTFHSRLVLHNQQKDASVWERATVIPAVSCMRSSRPVDDRWSHRLFPAFPDGFRWNLVSGPTFTPGMWFLFPLAELGQITWGGADTRRGIRDVLALPVVDVPVGLCDRGLSALSLSFELTLPRLVPLWKSETARRAEASLRFFSRKAEQLDKPTEGARSG